MPSPDEGFFADNPNRQAHIRLPGRQQHKDAQRGVRWLAECELQFRSLGDHDKSRRRIISYRVPRDNPMYDAARELSGGPPILVIPFLQFADETIEDEDRVLLPIVHSLMVTAAKGSL